MREGWEYKKLGEVCSPKKEIKRAPKVFAPNDTIKYIDISSIDNSTQRMTSCSNFIMSDAPSRAQQCVIKGDVIVSTVRPNLKNIAIVDSDDNNLVASSGFCVLRPCNIERDYLFHYIKSDKFTNHIMGLTTGANYPAVRSSDILESTIPVPPLSTQLSIVSELDKINELIRLKKEQLKDYDNLAQSIFYEMFGDPVVNEKGWEVKKLGEVCTYPNKRISLSDITSYEYVGVETLVKNKGGVLFTEELPNAKNAIEYIENDILIGNIRPYLKKIWKSDRHGGASGDVVIIRISDSMKGLLTPVYLFKLLSTDEFFEYDNANTHGAKMPRGDRKAIAEFTIQIPRMDIQQIFAQRIELIEQQKAEIQNTIADLETLLASRMQYWFD